MVQFDGFEFLGNGQWIARGDSLEKIRELPAKCADLVLADPPYNIKRIRGQKTEWDSFGAREYDDFMRAFMREITRVCKDNATLLMFHNQMPFLAKFICEQELISDWGFRSFIVFHKKQYRQNMTHNSHNRHFGNVCEYILHLTLSRAEKATKERAAQAMRAELGRIGFSLADFKKYYKDRMPTASGTMAQHYFSPKTFAVPSQEVWQNVFAPAGFKIDIAALAAEIKAARPYFDNSRGEKGNVYSLPMASKTERQFIHPCQKPVFLLADIMDKTCPPDGVVLDPFAGSFATAVAARKIGRKCISIERDDKHFSDGSARLKNELQQSIF